MIHGAKQQKLSAPLNWSEIWFDNKALWRMAWLNWNTHRTLLICTAVLYCAAHFSLQLHHWSRIKWLACPCEHSRFLFLSLWILPRLLLTMCYALSGKWHEACCLLGQNAHTCILHNVSLAANHKQCKGIREARLTSARDELWPIFPPTRHIFKSTITLIASEGCSALYIRWVQINPAVYMLLFELLPKICVLQSRSNWWECS